MTTFADTRIAMSSWGADVAGMMSARFWGFFLAAFVLATGVARAAYFALDLPQEYGELIVGNISWSYQNKFHDYAVLYVLVLAFLVGLIGIAALAARLRRVAGVEAAGRFHDLLLVLCMPSAMWLVQQLTTSNNLLTLLKLSQALVLLGVVVFALMAARREGFWAERDGLINEAGHHAVLFVLFSTFAVAAVGVAGNRMVELLHPHLTGWMSSSVTADAMMAVACAALLACGLVSRMSENPTSLLRTMQRCSIGAQCFLPLLLMCLVPPAWQSHATGRLSAGYPITPFAKCLIATFLGAAYIELFLRAKRMNAVRDSALRSLTVGSAIGLLLFLKTTPLGLPVLSSDDYHFGELIVPWWSWSTMGQVPFWDYGPARGLINYVPGLLTSVVFDGSPASIAATYPFTYAALALLAFPILRVSLGTGGAFVALLLGPFANNIGEVDIVVSVFLFAFCRGWLHWSPLRWLALISIAGVTLLLYAPGQAALALVAISPFVLEVMWRLYRTDRRRLSLLLGAIVVVLGAACVVTPFGKMFVGALRYGAEQSRINSIAHGVNWSYSFGQVGLNPWAFELMRTSFLLVALWAGVLAFKAGFMRSGPERRRILVHALPVLLLALLFVIRAAGRIDAGGSRLAIASVWALALLLPMLLFVSVRVRGVHFFIWAVVAGVVLPYAGSVSSAGYAGNFDPVDPAQLEQKANARNVDGGRLGSSLAELPHLERIEAVRKVLDLILEPSETYLDLSSRHALYYYVARRPAVESGAMYNLVGEHQQLRAIETIRAARFPAVLLSADNVTHDGGPPSLRSNLVYREVLLSQEYKLATIGHQVWMIRADRVARLAPGQTTSLLDLDAPAALNVLDPIFHQQNLQSIPASWGRSADSLERELSPVLAVTQTVGITTQSVRSAGPHRYVISGDDPWIRFDISGSGISGRQAGILSFDFACEVPSAMPGLGLYWTTSRQPEGVLTYLAFVGHPGRLIVPVDSAPSWLLADRIDTLRFDLDTNVEGCETFSITNVRLMARSATRR